MGNRGLRWNKHDVESNEKHHYDIHIHTDDKELADKITDILKEYYGVKEETEEEA